MLTKEKRQRLELLVALGILPDGTAKTWTWTFSVAARELRAPSGAWTPEQPYDSPLMLRDEPLGVTWQEYIDFGLESLRPSA